MRSLLLPFSFIYAKVMDCRNYFYNSGIFNTQHFDIPIVSVGNLTMGGTGKTPIICELIEWTKSKGLKAGVVSRGYHGKVRGVESLPDVAPNPAHFGDEPCMMKLRFPDVPIYVGADRSAVVDKLIKENKVDIVFADDAFQHRRLGRKLDIVVVDASEKRSNYRTIPVGRARENVSALQRAHFIILNKVNLVSPQQKQECLEFIESNIRGLNIPVIESEYYIRGLRNGESNQYEMNLKFEPVFLFSAIGNPAGFKQLIEKNFDVRGHEIFRDHHNFTKNEIERVLERAQASGAQKVLCTEKDLVKLQKHKGSLEHIWCVDLSVKLSIRFKQLYEQIIHLIH